MAFFREPPPERGPTATASGLTVDGSTQFLAITLPGRESVLYPLLLALVKDTGFQLEPSNRKWWLRDKHRVLEFLARHLPDLREKYRAQFTASFQQRTAHLQFAKLAASASGTPGNFEVSLELSAPAADEAALRAALARGQPYIETPSALVLVNPELVGRLAAAQQALGGPPAGHAPLARFRRTMTAAELPATESLLESLAVPFETPATWKSRSESLRHLDRLAPAPLPPDLARRLREYQRIGVAWLWHLWTNKLGGVLADEMGLGKTAQALALLQCLYRPTHLAELTNQPSLVVAPAGLLGNWRREAATWAPALRAFTHHGTERLTTSEQIASHQIVFTSYGTLARDIELFAAGDWAVVIADEAQHAKNRRTHAARALRALRARTRYALTGTPLENSFEDLRALFDFLLPGYLASAKGSPGLPAADRAAADTDLRRRAAPYVLRRTKALVAPELPPKIEQTIFCEFEPRQADLYAKTRERARAAFFQLAMGNASDGRLRMAAFEELLRLRQVCADPRLLDPEFADGDSAKLRALRELLDEAVDGGHRALVFSQFTSVLDLIEPALAAAGLPALRLDGSTPPRDRLEICDRFNADPSYPVLLISLKAGGTGLNLTGADTVIHFDPWWNPAVEAQATDRAHRLGQTRTVTNYKLIAAGTVEERVLALQQSKAGLLADFFEESGAAFEKISLADVRQLLED
ncbi:MAG TPA: DEAD/DEAH box helicase [Opitutales bacterium]|nr:DEAD/DEAH box helicase [Opitutales bacterium]